MNVFWKILDTIKQKSPEARTQASFLIAVCFTLVVGLLWVSTLPAQFSELTNSTSSAAVGSQLNVLKTQIEGTVNSIPNDTTEQKGSDEKNIGEQSEVSAGISTTTRGPDAKATSSRTQPPTTQTGNVMIETVTTTSATSKSVIMVEATSTP